MQSFANLHERALHDLSHELRIAHQLLMKKVFRAAIMGNLRDDLRVELYLLYLHHLRLHVSRRYAYTDRRMRQVFFGKP